MRGNQGIKIKQARGLQVSLYTFSAVILTTLLSSVTTKSIHLRLGSFRRPICFFTIASKAMSGVNKPTLIPDIIKNVLYRLPSTNLYVLSQSRLTVNISDGKCNLFPQFFLVKLHPDYFVGESLMEEPVDLSSSTELHGIDSSAATALNSSLKILLELLDHL